LFESADEQVLKILWVVEAWCWRCNHKVIVEIVVCSHGDRENRVFDQCGTGGWTQDLHDLLRSVLEILNLLPHWDMMNLHPVTGLLPHQKLERERRQDREPKWGKRELQRLER
jgi:hypothetical protein